MIVRKGFKFRLYAKKQLQMQFAQCAGACRWVFNRGLNQRNKAWEENKNSITVYQQNKELTLLKQQEETTWLKDPPSQILQQSLQDLDLAFQHFFRRVRNGETPGHPKFKCKGDHDSFRFPQGFKVEDNQVYLPKIGWVRFKKTRPIQGTIKQVTVIREGRRWYVCFSCGWEDQVCQVVPENVVGIDLGLEHFATLKSHTDEWMEDRPNWLQKGLSHLRFLSRQLSRKKKKSRNFSKTKIKLAIFYHRLKNQRLDFLHKLSTKLVKNHDAIVIENLSVKKMLETGHKGRSRAIADSGWRKFLDMLKYKCAYTGKYCLELDRFFPGSQICSNCGQSNKIELKMRTYECACGYQF